MQEKLMPGVVSKICLYLTAALLVLALSACADEGMRDGRGDCYKLCERLEECLDAETFRMDFCLEACDEELYYDARSIACAMYALEKECSAAYVNYCAGDPGIDWM